MSHVTRRGAFGMVGGAAGIMGLSACADKNQAVISYVGEASFLHGVACGDATQDSLIIWSRITPEDITKPVPVRWYISEQPDMSNIVQSGQVQTSAARDFTIKIDVQGLMPGHNYYYQFDVPTQDIPLLSPIGRARTLPAGDEGVFHAAIVSCSNYPFGFFGVYRAIADQSDLDAVLHLGDYIYEYGPDGYGGQVGEALGRNHIPAHETISLADYRIRHAQYKSDPDLQAAHARAVWYCGWDDHESTNNSYRTGAQNHNPDTEGSWSDRKQAAIQAYMEWMPVRDPSPEQTPEMMYRSFDIGGIAKLSMLETRLLGRSKEISWSDLLAKSTDETIMADIQQAMTKVSAPERTMLGQAQEDWLAGEMQASSEAGQSWHILGNQVIMAQVKAPNLADALTDEQKAAIDAANPGAGRLIEFTRLGLPANLDAWDGFPAARGRLYQAAKAANIRMVALAGDTHTAWANELHDASGEYVGVEFGCSSVSSPGLGQLLGAEGLNEGYIAVNEDVIWHDAYKSGFTLLSVSKDHIEADFHTIETVTRPDSPVQLDRRFRVEATEAGISRIESSL